MHWIDTGNAPHNCALLETRVASAARFAFMARLRIPVGLLRIRILAIEKLEVEPVQDSRCLRVPKIGITSFPEILITSWYSTGSKDLIQPLWLRCEARDRGTARVRELVC
jgi:hypothetical protein